MSPEFATLVDYVEKCMHQGMPEATIRQALAGWDKALVDEAIDIVKTTML